jgi:arsenite-transporting ATPase
VDEISQGKFAILPWKGEEIKGDKLAELIR